MQRLSRSTGDKYATYTSSCPIEIGSHMHSDPSAPASGDEYSAPRSRTFDIVVIGAGGAGLACAIEAAERGTTVAIMDAAPGVGGTASVAGGGTCIAGSPLQEQLGIDDSVERALEDWAAWGGESVDLEWTERYLRASTPELYERLAGLGVQWIGVAPHEGNRVARWHRPAGGGRSVMLALARKARTLPNLTWLFEHRVVRLVRSGGRVTGVATVSSGREEEVGARAVVVASGGFSNDPGMVAEFAVAAANAERVLLGGGVGARGEGHRMLKDVGAQFAQLDAVWMYPYATPDDLDPLAQRGLALRGMEGEIWINDEGVRFHDESLRGGATGTPALLQQPHGRCWSVFDAQVASRMVIADPAYTEAGEPIRANIDEFLRRSPHVESAVSIADLAARIGVDDDNLRDAIGQINSARAGGEARDPIVGKRMSGLDAIDQAPFYAVRLHPMARKNLGGVRTDLACRVLDENDRPIEGLFAAGEVAGMAGGRINGRAALEGTAFGPSVFSGMIAGRAVAG